MLQSYLEETWIHLRYKCNYTFFQGGDVEKTHVYTVFPIRRPPSFHEGQLAAYIPRGPDTSYFVHNTTFHIELKNYGQLSLLYYWCITQHLRVSRNSQLSPSGSLVMNKNSFLIALQISYSNIKFIKRQLAIGCSHLKSRNFIKHIQTWCPASI